MSDRKDWNHVPDHLLLEVAPIWRWPLSPAAIFRWYVGSWLPVSINPLCVGLSFAAYARASPTLEQAARPGLGMPPLKWSTHWDMTIPFSGGPEDGWQAREARRYRADAASS